MNIGEHIKHLQDKHPDLPDITHIGRNTRNPGVIVGCEDGSIAFTVHSDNGSFTYPRESVSDSGEAINGIASIGRNSLALSTRSEVTFLDYDAAQGVSKATFPVGAHGILATHSGVYASPLGLGGLMLARPGTGDQQKIEVSRPRGEGLYFYRLTSVHNAENDLLLCAHRSGGLGVCDVALGQPGRVVRTVGQDRVDIVDVCSIEDGSLASVAVSRDGDIVWIEDARHPLESRVFRPLHTNGIVYRALATPRHLCVLTSKALYVWPDLISLFRRKKLLSATRVVFSVQAVDIAIIDNELLLITGGRDVKSVSLESLYESIPRAVEMNGDQRALERIVEESDVGLVDEQWSSEECQSECYAATAY